MERRQIIPLLLAWAASLINEREASVDRPTILVEKIRKQLMYDNYDYMPTESEEVFPTRRVTDDQNNTQDTSADHYLHNDKDNELDSNINDHFIPRANNDLKSDDFEDAISKEDDNSHAMAKEDDNSHAIAKEDLLYYVDDETLTKKKIENENHDNNGAVETTSPKIKYKVLKVKQSHPNRRSQSIRRFIQEEGHDGVALINLDEGPFPEFRLPKTRRQYMMDQHDLESEEDAEPLYTQLQDSLPL